MDGKAMMMMMMMMMMQVRRRTGGIYPPVGSKVQLVWEMSTMSMLI